MRSINPNLKKSRSIKRGIKYKMPKRKRSKRYGSKSTGLKPMQVLIGAGLYGAVREKISNALTPLTSKVPLGNVADEVVLFSLGYLANRKLSNKTFKAIGQAAMAVEAARIGEAVVTGQVGLGGSSSNGAGSFFTPTIG